MALSQKERIDFIRDYAKKEKFSPAFTAGLLGNIERESSFNPFATNKKEGSYGFFQYYDAPVNQKRIDAFMKFMKEKFGGDPKRFFKLKPPKMTDIEKKKFMKAQLDFAFKKAFTSSVVSLTIAFNSCVVGGLLFLVWKAAILSPLTVWIAVSICCDVGLYFPRTPCNSNCLYWAFKYTPKLSLILSDTSAGILFCKRLRDILSTDLLKLRTAVSSSSRSFFDTL